MTEKQLWDFIDEAATRGSVYGLDSMKRLLRELGNPENKLKFIHIAGTNGKGSIQAFIGGILRSAGFKIGAYTSPAVFDYREKITVNGKFISLNDLKTYMETVKNASEKIVSSGFPAPTLFEMETALAFMYFADKNVDFAIVECGLGGKDDATNVIKAPVVAVFAHISRDHMHILGETLPEIALNKCGIIKPGCVVVSCEQDAAVKNVIATQAMMNGSKYIFAEAVERVRGFFTKQSFYYGDLGKFETKLLGDFQPCNAATAIEVALALKDCGYIISDKAIHDGIENAKWPGRFEIIKDKPLFIIDGAHNEMASIRLAESMDRYLKGKRIICICGVLADKEYEKVMANTITRAECVIAISPPENKRALDKISLAQTALKYCTNVTTADSVEEACEMAMLLASSGKSDSAVLAFGSLSYLGRVKRYVLGGEVCLEI